MSKFSLNQRGKAKKRDVGYGQSKFGSPERLCLFQSWMLCGHLQLALCAKLEDTSKHLNLKDKWLLFALYAMQTNAKVG